MTKLFQRSVSHQRTSYCWCEQGKGPSPWNVIFHQQENGIGVASELPRALSQSEQKAYDAKDILDLKVEATVTQFTRNTALRTAFFSKWAEVSATAWHW